MISPGPATYGWQNKFSSLCGAVSVLAGGIVLIGWTLGVRSLMGFTADTVPMHPITAVLFIFAGVALWNCRSEISHLKQSIGRVCAGIVTLAGLARLFCYLAGVERVDSDLLFREKLRQISAEIAPTHIQIAPNTALNFVSVGLAIFIMLSAHRRWRITSLFLAFAPALLSLLTIGGHFIRVDSLGSIITDIPMSLSTALIFLILSAGILTKLANESPLVTRNGTDSGEDRAGRRSLDGTITIGFAVALFMLCAIGVISTKGISQFLIDSGWSNHSHVVVAEIATLDSAAADVQSAGCGYVITGAPRYLDIFEVKTRELEKSIEKFNALTIDNPSQQNRLELIKPLVQRKLDILRSQIQLRESDKSDTAGQAALTIEGTHAMDEIRKVIDDMREEENRLLVGRNAATESNARRRIIFILFGSSIALILVALSGLLLRRDVAGRARIEAALQASETLFRGLLESAPDAIVIVDDHGKIEFFSKRAEKMFGYLPDEIRSQPIDRIISKKTDVGGEQFGIRRDGTKFPAEISLSPMVTASGRRISSAIRDVTVRKEQEKVLTTLNDDLKKKTHQLEVAYKELEAFSYSVSHDLRTPLRSLDGFSQALLEDYSEKLDAEGQDHLQRIRAASQRMGHLIDDLLNLSKVTRVAMSREIIDLSEIAGEVAAALHVAEPARKVEFAIQKNLRANADSHLIRIVLENLIGNAWKFTAKTGEAKIEFGSSGENGSTSYFVRDNGAGFDMAYADKLFGAFQRLHSVTDFPGTGIGLATALRIIHRHAGSVWAEGAVNAGATFHFTV